MSGKKMECEACRLLKQKGFKEKQLICENSNGRFFAFYNRDPITLGHVIVQPKKHVETIAGLDEAEAKELMLFIKKIYSALEKVMNTEKIYICSFNESKDMHLHFHLIPVKEELLPFTERYNDWGNKGPVLYFMLSTFKDWEKIGGVPKEYLDKYFDKKLKEGKGIIARLKGKLE